MKPRLVDARSEAEFEVGHIAGAVSLPPNSVIVFAEQEIPLQSREILVYAAKPNDEATRATLAELRKLGFENASAAPFGWDDKPDDLKTEVGPARWEILSCGG